MKEQISKDLGVGMQITISELKSSILAIHLWNYITKKENNRGGKK